MYMLIGTPASDASTLRSRVQEAKNAPDMQISQKFMQHRKSSIPFANRSPKVRFLRGAKSHGVTETGPCSPIVGNEEQKMVKKMKSILKKSEHPILIDVNLLSKLDIDEISSAMTNDLLGNCKMAVDQETQRLYTSERQARGAIDIVTFPSAYSIVEPFSRVLGTLIMCIETLEILRKQDNSNLPTNTILKQIGNAIQDFLSIVTTCEGQAKKFRSRSGDVFKQWTNVMKIKSEFYIEHNKINIPVYPNKTMPENVTLYEDVRDENERYLYDGIVTLALVKQVVCVWSESNDGLGIRQAFSNMTLDQQCEIIITLINHSKDLVLHSSRYITSALKTLTDVDYNDGFENVRKRLTAITFDDYFDPICGLDLKNSFGELIERKCELLNIANKMYQNMIRARKLITKLYHFTLQIVQGQSEPKLACCPCSNFYTKEKLLSNFRTITEVAINVPMSTYFQNIVFTPKSSTAVLGEGDQILQSPSFPDIATSQMSIM